MKRRIAGLLWKNKQGPWIYTKDIQNPEIVVKGLEGEMLVTTCFADKPSDDMTVKVQRITEDGRHKVDAAPFMRFTRTCCVNIICVVESA